MALVFRACFFQMMETTAVRPKVEAWLDEIEPLLEQVTPRERLHAKAVRSWVEGDILGATATWEDILGADPHDIIALKLHHYLTFWTGRSQALRSATAAVLPAWDEGIPGYASVLGMHAFALEETGNHVEAENWGRRAVELNPDDLWAVHSVAHVLETQGRSAEGAAWLDHPTDFWDDRNPFRGHVWWHAALFNLAQANYDKVLSLYDREIWSVNTKQNVDVQNLASLLARLDLRGVDVGDRWEALADHAENRIGDHAIAFNDIHWSLALALAKRPDSAARHIHALDRHRADGDDWNSYVFGAVGKELCRGLAAYGRGDYAEAAAILWPIKDDLAPIGGSHAQRDLFPQILGHALLESGGFARARSLFAEQVTLRPSSAADWRGLAAALNGLGNFEAAETANSRSHDAAEPG